MDLRQYSPGAKVRRIFHINEKQLQIKVCRNIKFTLFNQKNYRIPYFYIVRNCKIALFLLQRRYLGYILSEKIHVSYKMYFDGNISNVGIGLDVLINMPCIGDIHVSHEFVFCAVFQNILSLLSPQTRFR